MRYQDFFKEDCDCLKPRPDIKDIDPEELRRGIADEKEHTNDEELAKTISMHHLRDDPHYYSKLKKAGIDENDLMGLTSPLSLFPDKDNSKGIVEPDTDKIDKQTVQGTVFPKVNDDPAKGPDMAGCIGSTKNIESKEKTDVDEPAKDPTPTDHITGGISSTPSNPNILPKNNLSKNGELGIPQFATYDMLKSIGSGAIPQDISIDIAESKKLLKKMLGESTIIGPKNAFGPKREGFVPAGGTPGKDKAYVPGKRWTVKWRENENMGMNDIHSNVGDYNDEIVRQAVKTIIDQSTGDYDTDIGSILAYLQDQGINAPDDKIESIYRQEMANKNQI